MRYLYLVLAVLTALTVLTPTSGQAVEYPWCAQYGRNGGRNCGFTTWEQCMATVSGIGGFCERNSFYTGPERPVHRPPPRRGY